MCCQKNFFLCLQKNPQELLLLKIKQTFYLECNWDEKDQSTQRDHYLQLTAGLLPLSLLSDLSVTLRSTFSELSDEDENESDMPDLNLSRK